MFPCHLVAIQNELIEKRYRAISQLLDIFSDYSASFRNKLITFALLVLEVSSMGKNLRPWEIEQRRRTFELWQKREVENFGL